MDENDWQHVRIGLGFGTELSVSLLRSWSRTVEFGSFAASGPGV